MGHWRIIEEIDRRLELEQGTLRKEAPVRVALCYPSPYHVGMSSLGFQTIYRAIHEHPGATAERAFVPDDVAAWREQRLPLCTYETKRPVSEAHLLAVSVAYELELTGLFELLSLSGLPVLREERSDRMPLVVAGGPLTFSNPVPLEPFVDLLILGEADEAIHELLALLVEGHDKREVLERLAERPGFHVPGNGRSLPPILKAPPDRLPAYSQILTSETELRSMFLIEAERGCSRSCTYCVMRRSTNGGMRLVPPEKVLSLIPDHARKVGLVGAAVTDHPGLPQILRALVESGREVGISSLRADRLTPELVGLLAKAGYRTLTTASDGISQRMRDVVQRHTTEQNLLRAAQLAREAGMMKAKFYEMVGVPGETEADLDELARFTLEVSKILQLSLGIAPFVAKRNTPLDGAPFAGIAEVEQKLAALRRKVKGRVEIRPTSARWAWVEYLLAQSGAQAGLAAHDAWLAGGSFASWKRAFEARGVVPSG